MKFGITLRPDHQYSRSVDLAQRAEANGFSYGWIFDSHVLWRDPYPLLTLIGAGTERLRLGDMRHESGHPRHHRHRQPCSRR